MPLSRIEIEQIGPSNWVAEVEAGGTTARRKRVVGANFDDILSAVIDAHSELTAPPAPKAAPAAEVREEPVRGPLQAAQAEASERLGAEVEDIKASERARDDGEQPPDLDALRSEAVSLGIDVDGRWGERRLRHEITTAQDRQARLRAHDR